MKYCVTVDVTYSVDMYVEANNKKAAAEYANEKIASYDADMRSARLFNIEIYDVEEVKDELD